HAVLTMRSSLGDFVLDNLDGRVLRWTETDYTYLKRQSTLHTGVWVTVNDGPADAVARPDPAGIDEEHRLRRFRLLQLGDDPLRPILGRKEGAAIARHVVERQRDHLLRRRLDRQQQQKHQGKKPAPQQGGVSPLSGSRRHYRRRASRRASAR
ncbi:MAG: transglutaminase-like cysteine peptidase, partial [Sphingopyxis sp.]|nr:transglutaminase-like cysteine peptidase [Sphingopyxis sp.]